MFGNNLKPLQHSFQGFTVVGVAKGLVEEKDRRLHAGVVTSVGTCKLNNSGQERSPHTGEAVKVRLPHQASAEFDQPLDSIALCECVSLWRLSYP